MTQVRYVNRRLIPGISRESSTHARCYDAILAPWYHMGIVHQLGVGWKGISSDEPETTIVRATRGECGEAMAEISRKAIAHRNSARSRRAALGLPRKEGE